MSSFRGTIPALVLSLIFGLITAHGQAPSAVQVFMPNGDRPPRELRFTLTRDDGRMEILFTDSKGKFQLTGDLNRDREYSITLEGDGQTFETTTANIRLLRGSITYVPIFLRPYKSKTRVATGVIDVAALDSAVPADARNHYGLALKYITENQSEGAIAEFKRAIQIYPNYVRALNDLGVLYLKLNRLQEAASVLRKASEINGFQMARLNLGIVLNRQKKYSEASEILKPLYEENHNAAGVALALADALIGIHQLEAATRVLRETISAGNLENKAQVEAHYKLGLVLSRAEKYSEAVKEMQEVVRLDPNAGNAHLLLGGTLLQLKRYAESESELLRAYELGGRETANAQLLLGQLYTSQQKYDLALRAFEQYLKDVPQASNAAQVQASIAKLKEALAKKQD